MLAGHILIHISFICTRVSVQHGHGRMVNSVCICLAGSSTVVGLCTVLHDRPNVCSICPGFIEIFVVVPFLLEKL